MLWVSGELSRLARLSLASFRANGYRVTLWSYDPAPSLGKCRTCGMPQRCPSAARGGRRQHGLSHQPVPLSRAGGAGRHLGRHGRRGARPQIRRSRPARSSPPKSAGPSAMRSPPPRARASPRSPTASWPIPSRGPATSGTARWTASPPSTRRSAAGRMSARTCSPASCCGSPTRTSIFCRPQTVDPVAWWNVPGFFLEERDPPPSPFMHMYATIWTRRGVDAERPFPPSSLAGSLWDRFGLSAPVETVQLPVPQDHEMPAAITIAAPIQVKTSGKSPNSTRP